MTSPSSASKTGNSPVSLASRATWIESARRAAPAERAGHEHVDVARAAQLHRVLDLVLEVAQVGDRRGGDVGDLVRHRDQRGALALAEDVAGLVRRRPAWSSCARRAASRPSAARRCSCSPRCRNRCRARRRCARTSPTGSRSRCRRCRRRRPGRRRGCPRGPWPSAPRRCRSRPPARCRTASGSTAAARRSRGTASRTPRGSRSRWRRSAVRSVARIAASSA